MVKTILFSVVISFVALCNFLLRKDVSSKKKLFLTSSIAVFLIIYDFLWSICFC